MRYRALGRTGIVVSEIGFGSWGIGGSTPGGLSYGPVDDLVSRAALERAFELGITFIDTSNLYGMGHSESVIGETIRGRRDQVVIATKAGHTSHTEQDFDPKTLRRSLEGSLSRLGTDYVDVLQLHGPKPADLRARPEILGVMEEFRREGLIRSHGVSANTPADARAAIEEFGVPVVQANLSMLDLRALDGGLLDAAGRLGAGVIARTPLCFGFLTGTIAEDTVFPPDDHRSRWNGEQVARWSRGAAEALAAAGVADGDGPGAVRAALRFCLSFSAVSVTIPGILTEREAEENAAASDFGPFPPEVLEKLVTIGRALDRPLVRAT